MYLNNHWIDLPHNRVELFIAATLKTSIEKKEQSC